MNRSATKRTEKNFCDEVSRDKMNRRQSRHTYLTDKLYIEKGRNLEY